VIRTDPDFAHRVEAQMKPVVHLFTPIFFVMVGLSLNLREVDWGSSWIWGFSGLLLLAAIVGKAGGAMIVSEPWSTRAVIACAMVPRGEVGLIFAELGRTSGILPQQPYAGLVLVIAATTLIAPFGLNALYRLDVPKSLVTTPSQRPSC
jgi:Kef-type K+ transport system membrane component KefB